MSSNGKSNAILVILSVLIPIVGYVLFFVKKGDEPDTAKTYLYSALAGSIIGLLLVA